MERGKGAMHLARRRDLQEEGKTQQVQSPEMGARLAGSGSGAVQHGWG